MTVSCHVSGPGVRRDARLYTEGMDDVWKKYLEFVKLLFKEGARPPGGRGRKLVAKCPSIRLLKPPILELNDII